MDSAVVNVIACTAAFMVFGLLILASCKIKPEQKQSEKEKPSNVVSIHSRKSLKLEKNLELFLLAEQALLNKEHEKYLALRMQAIENARKNVEAMKQHKSAI